MLFADLKLCDPILAALAAEGYTTATPIQAAAIPHALEGRDILGSAQTGTGKTAAFALPVLQRLASEPAAPSGSRPKSRCLVLCPTRELATQIADGFRTYGRQLKLSYAVIFGGVSQHAQVAALRHGTDVIIATPGRFLDLMRQGHVDLSAIRNLVLDEADRMLDMGFIHDIRTIVAKLPADRQTLLFSATMPTEIRRLADSLLKDPAVVTIAPAAVTTQLIDESAYFVEQNQKASLLAHLYHELPMARTIVFTRTKHGADRVVRHLHSSGIRALAIHGNKTQNNRQRALHDFKVGKVSVLVATDIASRGIDVDQITHVVNYDLTHEPETYMHRIGRTGRAGSTGFALSFVSREESYNLKGIERLTRRKMPVKPTPKLAPAQMSEMASSPRSFDTPRSFDRRDREMDRRDHNADSSNHAPRSSHQQHLPTAPRHHSHSPRPVYTHTQMRQMRGLPTPQEQPSTDAFKPKASTSSTAPSSPKATSTASHSPVVHKPAAPRKPASPAMDIASKPFLAAIQSTDSSSVQDRSAASKKKPHRKGTRSPFSNSTAKPSAGLNARTGAKPRTGANPYAHAAASPGGRPAYKTAKHGGAGKPGGGVKRAGPAKAGFKRFAKPKAR